MLVVFFNPICTWCPQVYRQGMSSSNKRRVQPSAKSIAKVRRDHRNTNANPIKRVTSMENHLHACATEPHLSASIGIFALPHVVKDEPTSVNSFVVQEDYSHSTVDLISFAEDVQSPLMCPSHVYKVMIEEQTPLTTTTTTPCPTHAELTIPKLDQHDGLVVIHSSSPVDELICSSSSSSVKLTASKANVDRLDVEEIQLVSKDAGAPRVRMSIEYDNELGQYCTIQETLMVLDPINSPTPQWVVFQSTPIPSVDLVRHLSQSSPHTQQTTVSTPQD